MKTIQRFWLLLLLLNFCIGLAAPALAVTTTTTTEDGLQVTVEMDKEMYEPDEPITATITLKNTKYTEVTITNLEQLIPEGFELAEESRVALKNKTLGAKASMKLVVTMVRSGEDTQEGAQDAGNVVKIGSFEPPSLSEVFFGETAGVPHFPFWCVLLVVFLIFMKLT
ncbi:MAG: hypothetical protein IJB59_02735 [Oscillospiraceae bacterium]|nr:hypothetical protein [Oscillospiraceae bacterium]